RVQCYSHEGQCRLEVFFFQAEDGIRDFHVTGVQTCALPIYVPFTCDSSLPDSSSSGVPFTVAFSWASSTEMGSLSVPTTRPAPKIGRASCRERVSMLALGVGLATQARGPLAASRFSDKCQLK